MTFAYLEVASARLTTGPLRSPHDRPAGQQRSFTLFEAQSVDAGLERVHEARSAVILAGTATKVSPKCGRI